MTFRLQVKPGPGKYDPPNSLSDDEYQILLEDIDQAVAEGNRKYGYGYSYSYDYGEDIKSKPKPKPRSKLRPQIYYNRVRPKQYHHHHQQP
jgi:hypothetical protein